MFFGMLSTGYELYVMYFVIVHTILTKNKLLSMHTSQYLKNNNYGNNSMVLFQNIMNFYDYRILLLSNLKISRT